jgi:peptide/nickel transport system permease protein
VRYLFIRMLHAIPILIGVNLITFVLFFVVNSPDDMARMQLGMKHITPEAIEDWKAQRGYDKPLLWNEQQQGAAQLTETLFWRESVRLFQFDFGVADDGRDIGADIRARMGPSLAIAIPSFVIGLLVHVTLALWLVFFRASYLDTAGVVLSVVLMSISGLFYIIAGQYWVRTARAKGLSEMQVLFRHVLRNALIPILTGVVVVLPLLFMGSLILESFFGIPGLGSYTIDAIQAQDFAIVRAMVFLGAVLYIIGLLLTDLSYTWVDPRVRLR